MRKKALKYILTAIVVTAGIILLGSRKDNQLSHYTPRDYTDIIQDGTLRAVTEYNSVSYHLKGDTLEGFDYDLLQAFSQDKGLKLEITPEMSYEKRLQGMIEGQYDLLATGTLVNTQSKDSLMFTKTLVLSKQVLVQRKKESDRDSLYIDSQLELAHKTLHVIKNSPTLLRIHNLMEEIADTIYIEEIELYGAEQLLAMVSEGDIDYAVCDENIARSVLADYPNLDIDTKISFTQFYAWGVNKHAPSLLDSLNVWLDNYQRTKEYQKLYRKYFH